MATYFSELEVMEMLEIPRDKDSLMKLLEKLHVKAYRNGKFLDFAWTLHPETGKPIYRRTDVTAPYHVISTYWNNGKADTNYWFYESLYYVPAGRKVKLEDLDLDSNTLYYLVYDVLESIVIFLYYGKMNPKDHDEVTLKTKIYPKIVETLKAFISGA